MFDETRIQRDREICEKATPGLWEVVERGNTVKSHAITVAGKYISVASGISPRTGNAAFIALSRTELPAALNEIVRLQNELAEVRNEVGMAHTREDEAYAELAESQKRERAAVADLRDNADRPCRVCKKWVNGKCVLPPPKDCAGFFRWEWRGPQD